VELVGRSNTSVAPMESQADDTTVVVREFIDSDRREWDDFVLSHPHGSPFHLIAWKNTIEESYRYKPAYLLARGPRGVRGVLPLFLVQNLVVGKALISSPFGVYGGILSDSPVVRQNLYRRAKELGEQWGVDYIELRNAFPEQCVGESNVSRYVTFTQPLQPDEDALLESLPKKTRNMVRKSLKTPFTIRYGIRDARRLDDILSRNMRRLGTPPFPRHYFTRLLANFGEMADIREVWLDDQLMAASLNFYFQGQMHTYHAAADVRFNALGPNTFMYYDHIRWAGQKGLVLFDFGRSKKGTGVFEFKRHWNTTMRELPYEMILIRRKGLPNFSPANPKFDLAIRLWRKVPLPITRWLGPRLIRLFP
jgi:FemAB-related protein (PEP-CTERM system-associated)